MAMGGIKKSTRDNVLSNEIKILDLASGTWEYFSGYLPKGLVNFGTAWDDPYLYVMGGLSDEYCSPQRRATFNNKQLSVSVQAYRLHIRNMTNLGGWETLADLPHPRNNFSTASVGGKIYLVGSDYCDVFTVASNTWLTLAEAPDLGPGRPATCVVGSRIYAFGGRSEDEVNNRCFCLETEDDGGTWSRLDPLPVRQDVLFAFAHNSCCFVVGWQRAVRNVIHEYSPFSGRWTEMDRNVPGNFGSGGGCLVRRQALEKGFFAGSQVLKSEAEA